MSNGKAAAGAVLASLALLPGCATTIGVPVSVTHPAEINMAAYKQVVIGSFEGSLSADFTERVKESLVDSGQFKVLDRSQLGQILGEQRLAVSDLADTKRRVKLGKLLPGTALVTGRVQGFYEEKETRFDAKCREPSGKDKDGKTQFREFPCPIYTKTGTGTTDGGVDIVSVETGEIIKSKKLSSSCHDKTAARGAHPESPNKVAILACAVKGSVSEFVKAIRPWTETVVVKLHKDSSVPLWETGIRQVQLGDFAAAFQSFNEARQALETNPKAKRVSIAKAHANLGYAHRLAGRLEEALSEFSKAYTITPDPVYLVQREGIQKLQKEKEELARQGVKGQ